ncbi:MAG TPA: hypothetical protein VMR89_13250 [Actinomycetota bacterium]|nr:hypothetical protein [Actinomycetota bacterium]
MKIVERREHGGIWWGRTPDGAWFRWSAAVNSWEGPLAPPWPEPPRHPNEEAIVAAAIAAGGPSEEVFALPMNRVDAWWNRHFPPFSIRRLVFGLVSLPVIGAVVELLWVLGGREASLPRYLFVCVAGGVLLATAWLPGMRDVAERMQASGAFESRSPWPWRRRPMAPPPPLPPLRTTFRRDFLVALPFTLVIVLVMTATVTGIRGSFTPGALLNIAVAAVLSALLVGLRTSIWGLVLFSIAGGLLGGLAMALLSMMTFNEPGLGEVMFGWAIGSVILFLYAYPLWRGVRDMEARGFRLPMWIVMGCSVLLVSGAALVFLAER